MDSFLAELEAEGITDSHGIFTIDARLARRKMAAFQLPDPASYILKFVQAAVASGAPSLEVKAGRDVMTLAFPCLDWDLADTAIVGGAVLKISSLRRSALRHLATGLNAACRVATEVRWETPRGGLLLTGDGLSVAEGACPDLRLTIRKKRSLFQWFSGPPFWEEMRRLNEGCSYAPLDMRIDGREIERPRLTHLVGARTDHFGLSSPLLESGVAGRGLRLLFPDVGDYQAIGDKRWARLPDRQGPLLLDGWDGTLPMEARALLGVSTSLGGRGTWQAVLDGVCLKPMEDNVGHPGGTVVFDAGSLLTDFSEFRLVRDEDLAARLAQLRAELRLRAESITRSELEEALRQSALTDEQRRGALERLHEVLQTHTTARPRTLAELALQKFEERKVHLPPGIPTDKASNVAAVHGPHLPIEEPILALYDDTLFGSGKEGFVITERRLCWKRLMFPPNFLLWDDLPFLDLQLAAGKILVRGGEEISATAHEVMGALFAFLQEAPPLAPRGETMPEASRLVIQAALRTVGKSPNIGYHPYLPEAWRGQIRRVYGAIWVEGEVPLVAYDDTLMGKADEGWVATAHQLYWKPTFGEAQCLPWAKIKPDEVEVSSGGIQVGSVEVNAHLSDLRPAMARFVKVMAQGGVDEPA